jgi:hypothetical protein
LRQNDHEDLDRQLLAAHSADDKRQLVRLYAQAADLCEAENRIDAVCFYLTHAYVFALEIGDNHASALRERLVVYGREE